MNANKPTEPKGIEDAYEVMEAIKKKAKLKKDVKSPDRKPQRPDENKEASTQSS